MTDAGQEPVSHTVFVRVEVEYRRRSTTYLIDCSSFSRSAKADFFLYAGDLLADLRALRARDSPSEGSLVQRVERHTHTVAAEPSLEAAIGFHDCSGETGLVRVTCVPRDSQPKVKK